MTCCSSSPAEPSASGYLPIHEKTLLTSRQVKNWRLILRCALTDVPKALVDAASEFNADYIVLGQEKSKKYAQRAPALLI